MRFQEIPLEEIFEENGDELTCEQGYESWEKETTQPQTNNKKANYRRGSKGHGVWVIQRLLNAGMSVRNPGATQLKEDGIFGPKTDAAVRAFQGSNSLAEDGIVGPITWGRLLDNAVPKVQRLTDSELLNEEIAATARDIMCFLPEVPHANDMAPYNWPLLGAFNTIVNSNVAVAKRFSVQPAFENKLLEYSKYNMADGAWLLRGYLRCPSMYEGGYILKTNAAAGAMTLDKAIFWKKGFFPLEKYIHEMVHVAQYRLTGVVGFLQTYFDIAAATIIYRWLRGQPTRRMNANPHENHAYEVEARFTKWLTTHPL